MIYFARRFFIVMLIYACSIVLNDINVVLSLFAGSICGTLLFVLPVVFYRHAYLTNPSKRDRGKTLKAAYVMAVFAVIVGLLGVWQNISKLLA